MVDDDSAVDLFSLIVGAPVAPDPRLAIADAAPETGLALVSAPAARADGFRKTVHAGASTPSIWHGHRGRRTQTDTVDTLRSFRKGDPQHKSCGKHCR